MDAEERARVWEQRRANRRVVVDEDTATWTFTDSAAPYDVVWDPALGRTLDEMMDDLEAIEAEQRG